MSSYTQVHKWLVGQGFALMNSRQRKFCYEGVLNCDGVPVPVRITFDNLDFSQLPAIYFMDPRPKELSRPLPHIEPGGKLCYLDEETVFLDRYQPVDTFARILGQVKFKTIQLIKGEVDTEAADEFPAYWKSGRNGLLLSNQNDDGVIYYNCVRYNTPLGKEQERVVAGSDEDINDFIRDVGGSAVYNGGHCPCLILQLTKPPFLPDSGRWPPNNFKTFFTWLESIDRSCAKRLSDKLGTKLLCSERLLIVLKSRGGLFGIEVFFGISFKQVKNNTGRFRNKLLHDKGISGIKICRVYLDESSHHHIVNRNLPGISLEGLNICLIGFGTIGGYLARLLVQSGVGIKGKIVIYDDDYLKPGNLGRHYLDRSYLYENKAASGCHRLLTEFPGAQISAKDTKFLKLSMVKDYDLVIDSTGKESFSVAINQDAIDMRKKNIKIPPMLHVWVDGGGHCGRTLWNDGKRGCYRCMRQVTTSKNRYPPLRPKIAEVPIRYRCGESYIPFPPSASIQAAAMGLEAVLNLVNKSELPTFRSRSFSGYARDTKDQNLSRLHGCPACQS